MSAQNTEVCSCNLGSFPWRSRTKVPGPLSRWFWTSIVRGPDHVFSFQVRIRSVELNRINFSFTSSGNINCLIVVRLIQVFDKRNYPIRLTQWYPTSRLTCLFVCLFFSSAPFRIRLSNRRSAAEILARNPTSELAHRHSWGVCVRSYSWVTDWEDYLLSAALNWIVWYFTDFIQTSIHERTNSKVTSKKKGQNFLWYPEWSHMPTREDVMMISASTFYASIMSHVNAK